MLVQAALPLGRVSYLDGRVLGDSASKVGCLLVDRAQVFWFLPPILLLGFCLRVVHVVTVRPVLPLPTCSVLLQSQLVVVEALMTGRARPLRVALVGIGRGHLTLLAVLRGDGWVTQLVVLLALFHLNGLERSRPS